VFFARVSWNSAGMNLQSIKRVLISLYHEMLPPVLFFFTAFLLIGVIFKLLVTQYSIQFTAFTKAAVAALIIGKVILLIDWAESGRDFGSHRRIVVIACQTFVYAFTVSTLGIGERILEAAHKAHSLREGFDMTLANAHFDRFIGLVILISMLVFVYLVFQEIQRALGKGALYRLLIERPDPISEGAPPPTP
jgi:hypothetical protein